MPAMSVKDYHSTAAAAAAAAGGAAAAPPAGPPLTSANGSSSSETQPVRGCLPSLNHQRADDRIVPLPDLSLLTLETVPSSSQGHVAWQPAGTADGSGGSAARHHQEFLLDPMRLVEQQDKY
jgi:hypothetical protein